MSGREWISVFNRMPGINMQVEILFKDGKERKAGFDWSSHLKQFVFSDSSDLVYCSENITHWRPIPEKRPDFSKLKEGDFIILETEDDTIYRAIFLGNHKDWEYPVEIIYSDRIGYTRRTIKLEIIKKVTRINTETKTFEEI